MEAARPFEQADGQEIEECEMQGDPQKTDISMIGFSSNYVLV